MFWVDFIVLVEDNPSMTAQDLMVSITTMELCPVVSDSMYNADHTLHHIFWVGIRNWRDGIYILVIDGP